MDIKPEDLERGIPSYLSAADKDALVKALRDFPDARGGRSYYFAGSDPDPLQGDVWAGVKVRRYEDGAEKRIRAMLVSNSCDMTPSNQRLIPPRVSLAGVIKLSKYKAALVASGQTEERAEAHLEEIRAQRINALFYLPVGGPFKEEHLAVLQDLHSVPLKAFGSDEGLNRVSTFSQLGFYLLLFKLSIHFCRFLEGVDRGSLAEMVGTADQAPMH